MENRVLKTLLEKITPYLEMPHINEIIFVQEKEFFLERAGEYFRMEDSALDGQFLRNFCIQLANARNLNFDAKHPALSCSIPHTRYRIQALHASITRNNQIALNIRVPSMQKYPLTDFLLGPDCSLDYEGMRNLVQQGYNILISGGTGSGKTSLLNTLIEEIPLHQRIVTIEDSPELHVKNPNKTQILVGKQEEGGFTYEDALNSAMRLSPQRLLLGEIDTRNTMLFLRLGNTGHEGMISTLHANSIADALKAISLNIKMYRGAKDIDAKNVEAYFKSAVHYIIQIQKQGKQRMITQIQSTQEWENGS